MLLFCVCMDLNAQAQTLMPSELGADEFRRLLQQNRQNNTNSFGAQLVAAERAFAAEDFSKALLHYDRAAKFGAPNSRWFLGKSALFQAMGKELNAQLVLKDGVKMYPYSNRLAMAFARQTILKAERLPTYEEIEELKLPSVAKVQVKALVAFRQNDYVTGLLATERAHYLAPDELIDAELAETYFIKSVELSLSFYNGDCGQGSMRKPLSYEPGSFEDVYWGSMVKSIRTLNKLLQDSSIQRLNEIDRTAFFINKVVDIRVATLRNFVVDGHLGRFQDPMLVDLHILDKAGHLKGATAQLFLKSPKTFSVAHKDDLTAMLPQIAAAQQYMDTQWSKDVDAFLAKF